MTCDNFIAFDSEGKTFLDGTHRLTLLMNSNDEYIENAEGLSTKDCIDFLCKTANNVINGVNIFFASNYDWNMFFKDLSRESLEKIHKMDDLNYAPFIHELGMCVAYVPGKFCTLYIPKQSDQYRFTFYDIFSFFGTSFINVCESLLGENYPHKKLIEEGKKQRSSGFESVDTKKYCQAELKNMVLIIKKLEKQIEKVLGVSLRDYHGSGALGNAILRFNKTNKSFPDEDFLLTPLRHSFSAGRIELIRPGYHENVYKYDINSAYPAAMIKLPKSAIWTKKRFDIKEKIDAWSIYNLEWTADDDFINHIQPFHHRNVNHLISYAPYTTGWYTGFEVIQALRLGYGKIKFYDDYYKLNILPYGDSTLQDHIQHMYKQRAEYKAAGKKVEQKVIKLGLNSLYGKFCQQLGIKTLGNIIVKKPMFFNLTYATFITGITRATILKTIIDNGMHLDNSAIAIETDCIFSTRKLENIKLSTDLGDFGEEYANSMHYLMSGIYLKDDMPHFRGIRKSSWTIDMMVENFKQACYDCNFTFQIPINYFRGMGWSLIGQRFDKLCTWEDDFKIMGMADGINIPSKRIHDINCSCQNGSHTTINNAAYYLKKGGENIPYHLGDIKDVIKTAEDEIIIDDDFDTAVELN